MIKRFQRRKEDFTCENCATAVKGSGFTNHCPACLWSKHVDENPGDRAADCKGLMEPVSIEQDRGSTFVVHLCQACGLKKRNRLAENDDFQIVMRVSKSYALKAMSGS